jgi:CHAD domain-containing protein
MTISANVNFILSGATQIKNMGKKLGKLKLEYHYAEDVLPFELLDCFDQSIRKSGRVLIQTNKTLQLLQQDGTMLTQRRTKANRTKVPGAKMQGFVADLPEGVVKDALACVSSLRSLLVVGEGALNYGRVIAVDDEHKTHARAHIQTFQVEGAKTSVTLATLQSLRGYDNAFDALELKISEIGSKVLQNIASMYECLMPEYQDYNSNPVIAITQDEKAFQAANDIISTFIAVARLNEPGIIADYDSEFLHSYRVSLRKVRSVVSLFKGVYSDAQTDTLKQAFSAHMEPTGRLRDLDVYLLERAHYFELLPESLHDGLTTMFSLFVKERDEQCRLIAKRFTGAAYNDSINALAQQFANQDALQQGPNASHSAYSYACELILKRYRKVCKIARSIDETTDDEEVHELRIHCKKLRYLMEFFSPLFPDQIIKQLIKSLKRLQNNLGLFNDYSVQQESLQAFLATHTSKSREQDLSVAKSVGALIVVLHQRQLEERAKVVANFAYFDSETTQQQFRALFQH